MSRLVAIWLVILIGLAVSPARAADPAGVTVPPPISAFIPLPKPGKKVPIDQNHYFVFSFDKKPSMDTVIVKVEVYANNGRKDASLEVYGDADMPSMKGAHCRGDQPFRLNKKGDYLLPITFVMPGDWEVYFTFLKGGTVVFRGRYAFDI